MKLIPYIEFVKKKNRELLISRCNFFFIEYRQYFNVVARGFDEQNVKNNPERILLKTPVLTVSKS